jgi:hypothetical protein
MANDYLKNIKADQFEQLANMGLIQPDTYQRVKAQVAPMSVMSDEQMGQTEAPAAPPIQADQASQVTQPQTSQTAQPQIQLPTMESMKNPDYLKPFTAEGTRQRAVQAAQAGDLDEADRLSSHIEQMDAQHQQNLDAEHNSKIAKFEQDTLKAQNYNQRAQKMGLPPINMPTPDAYGIDNQDLPATDKDIVAATIPTVKEVEAVSQPIRHQAAIQTAAIHEQDKQVQKALTAEQDLAQKQAALEDAAKASIQKEQEDNPYGNTFGERLRLAFAAGLGSFAKGENPVLKAIEGKQKKIQENAKLTQEQKIAQQKMAIDLAQLELKKLDSATDSQYKKAQIAKISQELAKESDKKSAALQIQLRAKEGLTKDDIANLDLDDKVRDRLVVTKIYDENGQPKDVYKLANNSGLATELNKYIADVDPSEKGIERILNLSKDYKMVQKLNPLDPQRKAIETELVALTGALRLPFTGPGQLLENEYQRLRGVIGNPNKILTLPEAERASLETVLNKLNDDKRIRYNQAGIDLPMSRQDKEIALLQKRNPDVPITKIRTFYNKGK